MSKLFYPSMAMSNLKKNSRLYIPFLLTGLGTVALYYNMSFLASGKDLTNISAGVTLKMILSFAAGIIAFFALIFLFYTNSFLIKGRKKEFGLYNVLGLEKKHIARLIIWESLFSALISIGLGLAGGILFSKLMLLLLFKIVSFRVPFGFEIPAKAVLNTLALFAGIFFINTIHNVWQVYRSKPIELLQGGETGEKEPKSNLFLTLIGLLTLGAAYYFSLTTESPIAAINYFFLAVILAIIGTHCLFAAGSITLLKALQKNKRYYYRLKNFIPISSMMFRMKKNAAGLANICILSTAVIIMLSTTISLYVGMEDVLHTMFPHNIKINGINLTEEEKSAFRAAIDDEIAKAEVTPQDIYTFQRLSFMASQDDNRFSSDRPTKLSFQNMAMIDCYTVEEYNRLEEESLCLEEGELIVHQLRGKIAADIADFNGLQIKIKEKINDPRRIKDASIIPTNLFVFIVKDLATMEAIYRAMDGENDDSIKITYRYAFDLATGREDQIALADSLIHRLKNLNIESKVEALEKERAGYHTTYGGLFFIGIFLGLLFIVATILIIYYKQIAEGYDDKQRFEIMQKVGMSRREIQKIIGSQVRKVFFLPLLAAVIHLAFAFKVITKLLFILSLTNVKLYAQFTALAVLVFALFYIIVYSLTAKAYYRIVKN